MANKTSPKIFYLSVLLSAVLVVLASGNARAQAGNNPVSPQPKAALLNLPVPPISGPGYQDVNIADAFQIGNRRGHDPFRKQNRRQFQNADANGGNTNYLLTVPVITLPGRALNVGLTLYYNSQMWTKQTEMVGIQYPIPEPVMVFDHDADWPAPGWLLSLGKVIQVGSGGGVLQDSDGTLHPFAPKGGVPPGSAFQTTDGSLIDYTVIGPKNTFQPTARFPNGTAVAYGACSNNACYATTITDANGNFISISYVGNAGPRIEHIQDSLGRVIGFGYDSNNRLVSIIAPGLQGSIRTIMRLQ